MKRVLLPVVLAITMVVFIGSLTGPSVWGQNDAFLIYGNRNGSVMTVFGGEIIEIPAWGVTYESITFMHLPLASNDSIISNRLGGYFPDSLPDHRDDESFNPPYDFGDGWTSQSMLAFNTFHAYWFITNGDTTLICTFRMAVMADDATIGDTICPFRERYSPANRGLLWGVIGGVIAEVPITTYPRLFILPSSNCQYTTGDVNGDGRLNGMDAVYGSIISRGARTHHTAVNVRRATPSLWVAISVAPVRSTDWTSPIWLHISRAARGPVHVRPARQAIRRDKGCRFIRFFSML